MPQAEGVTPVLEATVGTSHYAGQTCSGQAVSGCGCAEGDAVVVVTIPAGSAQTVTVRITNSGTYGPDQWYLLQIVEQGSSIAAATTTTATSTTGADSYEPDDYVPGPLYAGVAQVHTFDRSSDVDRVEFDVIAGNRLPDIHLWAGQRRGYALAGAHQWRHYENDNRFRRSQFGCDLHGADQRQGGPHHHQPRSVWRRRQHTVLLTDLGATGTLTPTPTATAATATPTITPTPTTDCNDAFESDDLIPQAGVAGVTQARTFALGGPRPDHLYGQGGGNYRIETSNLPVAVDTFLIVQFRGAVLTNDDVASGDLSSAVEVSYTTSGDLPVYVLVLNMGLYGATMTMTSPVPRSALASTTPRARRYQRRRDHRGHGAAAHLRHRGRYRQGLFPGPVPTTTTGCPPPTDRRGGYGDDVEYGGRP
jgi:hypothetical protein